MASQAYLGNLQFYVMKLNKNAITTAFNHASLKSMEKLDRLCNQHKVYAFGKSYQGHFSHSKKVNMFLSHLKEIWLFLKTPTRSFFYIDIPYKI